MKLSHSSILFVPASDTAIVLNSFIYDVDAIMFDLEDCVALCEKDTAHLILFNA
ncbi:aldolase/citrate lyase family protein [Photobacterium phosphoreum]|uniref:aldolase/citrate lyase family protein n=1 Tax=Photobacterium phosphoreum TaxID=659 RepID=UPI0024314D33|nr:aldolase/citrate lyase family protein [Photobacterium phosphoreum]